ncbi:MAG: hypothetical protein ACFCVH_08475 [Alphaproteobacteria bacterium]
MIMPMHVGEGTGRRDRSTVLSYIPFIGVVAVVYLVVGVISSSALSGSLLEVTLFSGALWSLATSELFIILGLIALLVELLKALRIGGHSAVDHMLSMLVFVGCLLCFLLWGVAATTGFLLITIMALVDVMAGFAVSLATARRDISIDG